MIRLASPILEEVRQRCGFVISELERGTPTTVMQILKQRYAR
jgi:hypothetical protein